jgi:GNAT superfamily N-acetyltransferase
MTGFTIRDAVWPQDEPACIGFIDGLQAFEHAYEKNLRIDPRVGVEYFEVLTAKVRANGGLVRIAERDGQALGWIVALVETDEIYVVEAERRFVYISELFVSAQARGLGAGRALIASCEDWARARGISILKIGVLAGNARAAKIYAEAGYGAYAQRLRKYLA